MTSRTYMPIMLSDDDKLRERRGERLMRVKQVPWAIFVKAHERQSQENHDQSLETIASRGGFSACEMLAVLSCTRWQALDAEYAHRLLYAMVVAFNRGGLLGANDEHPIHRLKQKEAPAAVAMAS